MNPIQVAARTLLGPQLIKRLRGYVRRSVPSVNLYRSLFEGSSGIEIGGPSAMFSDDGELPIYRGFRGLDNCHYSDRTIGTGAAQEGQTFQYHPQRAAGNQFICDATDLTAIGDTSYESLLASHCLEHVANPLRALGAWKRVLKADGVLLLILPHKDGTFDWRRPTTTLAHMVSDYEGNIGEDDLSHLPEILALHDLEKDRAAGTKDQFRQRCLNNYSNRAMHHHVFDTRTALALVDRASFQIIRVDTFRPYHIIILARRCERHNNTSFLANGAEYRRSSPFVSDRANLK